MDVLHQRQAKEGRERRPNINREKQKRAGRRCPRGRRGPRRAQTDRRRHHHARTDFDTPTDPPRRSLHLAPRSVTHTYTESVRSGYTQHYETLNRNLSTHFFFRLGSMHRHLGYWPCILHAYTYNNSSIIVPPSRVSDTLEGAEVCVAGSPNKRYNAQ